MHLFRTSFLAVVSVVITVSGFALANETPAKRSKRSNQPLEIRAVAWGPTQADVDAAKARVEQSPAVLQQLNGSKYRLLSFEYVDTSTAGKNQPTQSPNRFRVIFYNYSKDIALVAEGDFAAKEAISVREEYFDPGTGKEEINAAFEIIKSDAELGPLFREGKIELYEAMPPVSNRDGERLVNIGARNRVTGVDQIVGVSFKNSKVVKYENNAPPTSRAAPEACGIPSSGQGSTGQGVAGQYQLTVSPVGGGSPIWEMLVVRPSVSSGASGERSGLEVRDVKYKGKSVLKRGHAPVLNVQYINNTCGPFRDWQYSEGFFAIPSTGVTFPNGPSGGMAVLPEGGIATTSVETRVDAGNFQGVAIYQQDVGLGTEVVLVTEMNAGWYRYIMEWRFNNDGTIRPRYGFGSVTNGCVCQPRNHHVYWRFDFDIVQPGNQIYRVERNRKFLVQVPVETTAFRSYQLNRGFLIQNSAGPEAYRITPGPNDGSVTNANGVLTDTFGTGDFWLMQFKGTAASPLEIDDPNPPFSAPAVLSPWINNESLDNQDVVVWYSAHQRRVDDASLTRPSEPNVITGLHVVGPDLRPIRW